MNDRFAPTYTTQAIFEIRIGDLVLPLVGHDAFKLGLFLTGHNWASSEGKVLYMGHFSSRVTLSSPDNKYPSSSISEFYVESEGYDTGVVTLILGPNDRYTVNIKALFNSINEFLKVYGIPRIPLAGLTDEKYDDRKSKREDSYYPIKIPTADKDIYLAIKGSYINYINKDGETHISGIFAGNRSVSRPDDVGLLFLGE